MPGSTRPETPPVFLWKDPQGGEVIVIYENDYGGTIRIPGFNHILQFDFFVIRFDSETGALRSLYDLGNEQMLHDGSVPTWYSDDAKFWFTIYFQ